MIAPAWGLPFLTALGVGDAPQLLAVLVANAEVLVRQVQVHHAIGVVRAHRGVARLLLLHPVIRLVDHVHYQAAAIRFAEMRAIARQPAVAGELGDLLYLAGSRAKQEGRAGGGLPLAIPVLAVGVHEDDAQFTRVRVLPPVGRVDRLLVRQHLPLARAVGIDGVALALVGEDDLLPVGRETRAAQVLEPLAGGEFAQLPHLQGFEIDHHHVLVAYGNELGAAELGPQQTPKLADFRFARRLSPEGKTGYGEELYDGPTHHESVSVSATCRYFGRGTLAQPAVSVNSRAANSHTTTFFDARYSGFPRARLNKAMRAGVAPEPLTATTSGAMPSS